MIEITLDYIKLFIIGATLISGIIAFLAKGVIKLMFDKSFETYKNNLQLENNTAKLVLDKEIESFKSTMNILVARQSSLYQKRSEVIETLYKHLINFYYAMYEMTSPIHDITDQNEIEVSKNEQDRIAKTSELGNQFIQFYIENKIYFDKETCKQIDEIKKLLKQSHSDFTFNQVFGLPLSEITFDIIKKARELVVNEIPKLIDNLEESFRKSIGVIENNNND